MSNQKSPSKHSRARSANRTTQASCAGLTPRRARAGGRPRYWTDERIDEVLAPFLAGRTSFPIAPEFEEVEIGGLLRVLRGRGGLAAWAARYGVPAPRRGRPRKAAPDEQTQEAARGRIERLGAELRALKLAERTTAEAVHRAADECGPLSPRVQTLWVQRHHLWARMWTVAYRLNDEPLWCAEHLGRSVEPEGLAAELAAYLRSVKR